MKDYAIDQVSFQVREAHDFSWLKDLGYVFKVFDEQDSGNICFGVERDGKRKFVKYAGAKPQDYLGDAKMAVKRLKDAVPLYEELAHRNLIQYLDDFETKEGQVIVFDWFEGECLHPHWAYPPPQKYTHPESPYFKYRHLPLRKRLASFDAILTFHVFMESRGYVAIDLYDGSILYDFETGITKVCDIDFYNKGPVLNTIGEEFWGSTRSKSPEEFEKGQLINHQSNAYTLGALAYSIFGGETDRSLENWEAGEELYSVAKKATERNRSDRFSSIHRLKEEWDRRNPYL
ncbi:serine/threonine protein kinase [Halobacillus salinus]|uniref:serine/threonine protein kinase n=1 Tax=Halobacillus salinus TaxID=192814 RepID=UPI001F501FBD|nr:serine/threonine protein kinase [Halobacillus salinus]